MKMGKLLSILEKFDPDMDIIIRRDVSMPGYGFLDKIEMGIFKITDFGNDFFKYQEMLVGPDESKALCFVAEEDLPEEHFTDEDFSD